MRGFDDETQLHLDVRATGARRLENCRAQTLIDVAVSLSAVDGSISGGFSHTLRVRDQWLVSLESSLADAWQVASAEPPALSSFAGSLQLAQDESRNHSGTLIVDLTFSDAGARGNLRPVVEYADDGVLWSPVEAQFPHDGCSPFETPMALDATIEHVAMANGQSAAEFFDEVRLGARVQAAEAVWRNAGTTEVVAELGAARAACLGGGPLGTPSGLSIATDVSIATEDGRVAFTQPARAEFHGGGGASVGCQRSLSQPIHVRRRLRPQHGRERGGLPRGAGGVSARCRRARRASRRSGATVPPWRWSKVATVAFRVEGIYGVRAPSAKLNFATNAS